MKLFSQAAVVSGVLLVASGARAQAGSDAGTQPAATVSGPAAAASTNQTANTSGASNGANPSINRAGTLSGAQSGVINQTAQPNAATPPMSGQQRIRLVQEKLAAAGIDPGTADGRFHTQTAKALRDYQRGQGLPVTGRIDQPTLAALGVLQHGEAAQTNPDRNQAPVQDNSVTTGTGNKP